MTELDRALIEDQATLVRIKSYERDRAQDRLGELQAQLEGLQAKLDELEDME